MDQKKKVVGILLAASLFLLSAASTRGQSLGRIRLMDKQYEYGAGNDSLTLFFNLYDKKGERQKAYSPEVLNEWLQFQEGGQKYPIKDEVRRIFPLGSGRRIPDNYTFSVLMDLTIPDKGKARIYEAVKTLVESAPDSCVFLSFFGDYVTSSHLVTKENIQRWESRFSESASEKCFYSALYAKISEFNDTPAALSSEVISEENYAVNSLLVQHASKVDNESVLFVFTEGHQRPVFEPEIDFIAVTNLQRAQNLRVPRVYAFYYTENGNDPDMANCLIGISSAPELPENRKGAYQPASDMDQVLQSFETIINEKSYDYAFRYRVGGQSYAGQVHFRALWQGEEMGTMTFTVGSPERPWPERNQSTGAFALKFLLALLIAVVSIALYFLIMKILIPWVQSLLFRKRYYKKYVPDAKIQRRVCHYCRQEILEGQRVVAKCSHIMHEECWRQNGYKCSEYGQNCNSGIEKHIHWNELFTKSTFMELFQMICGVAAAFVSWLVFDLSGRGGFELLSKMIVEGCLGGKESQRELLMKDCIAQIAAFLMIGFLLSFFLSLVFRYNDEYRRKDWKILLKIVGLSFVTGIVGMMAFALGSVIYCWILSVIETSFIPWYCSLPGYIFFSLAISLFLTWKSSIPLKSALVGGLVSSIIGFIVLLFTSFTFKSAGWMNLLLDFIIFGGGLGASLVTVRMLAEHYFLLIRNGVRAGQKIPIHKWMSATGGGNKVTIGMTGECEIQMNWEKSNKVAKQHAVLYVDAEKKLPIIKPLATNVIYNNRMELPVGKPYVLSNGDVFKIGDTLFQYVESE